MPGLTFDRVAACGGAAFTLFALSTLAVAPPTPDVGASATEIRGYLVDEHVSFGFSVALMALAVLALCLAFGHIWRRLSLGSGGTTLTTTFLIAGAVAATTALAGVLLQGVLAVALVAAIGGASTALLNLGSDVTAPLVLDVGSFLLTCVWLTAVTVSAFVTKQPSREPAYARGR